MFLRIMNIGIYKLSLKIVLQLVFTDCFSGGPPVKQSVIQIIQIIQIKYLT